MTTVLTFGDSNTFGTPPMRVRGTGARYDQTTRWPRVMQRLTDCDLIEEGLPGRTACPVSDPIMGAHMNGHLGLRIALQSHSDIDVLTIMLGTNDQKAHFGCDAAAIAAGVAGLVGLAQTEDYQNRHGGFEILLICPPAVTEAGILAAEFQGAPAKSAELPRLLSELAQARGVHFLDAGSHIATSPIDGVHFDDAAHRALGKAVSLALPL